MAYSDFNWITDRLAVGGFVFESDDLPFDAVLSMETQAPVALRDLVRSGRVDYRWLSIVDGHSWETREVIVRRFNQASELIHDWLGDGKRVLVHCHAGVSRSVTAVTWYLMRYEGYSWDDALRIVRESRQIALPNIRFEAVMRAAGGERIDDHWIESRAREFCALMEPWGVLDAPERIRNDLTLLGLLPEREAISS